MAGEGLAGVSRFYKLHPPDVREGGIRRQQKEITFFMYNSGKTVNINSHKGDCGNVESDSALRHTLEELSMNCLHLHWFKDGVDRERALGIPMHHFFSGQQSAIKVAPDMVLSAPTSSDLAHVQFSGACHSNNASGLVDHELVRVASLLSHLWIRFFLGDLDYVVLAERKSEMVCKHIINAREKHAQCGSNAQNVCVCVQFWRLGEYGRIPKSASSPFHFALPVLPRPDVSAKIAVVGYPAYFVEMDDSQPIGICELTASLGQRTATTLETDEIAYHAPTASGSAGSAVIDLQMVQTKIVLLFFFFCIIHGLFVVLPIDAVDMD